MEIEVIEVSGNDSESHSQTKFDKRPVLIMGSKNGESSYQERGLIIIWRGNEGARDTRT